MSSEKWKKITEERSGKAVIKVVGIGGGGNNAINRMVEAGMSADVQSIAVNTDQQVLMASKANLTIQIGKGLGAGGIPEVGKEAAEKEREVIKEALSGADLVFITAGMGGGTGTGAAPVVANIAKDMGILTVGVVTKPFRYEGPVRTNLAEQGIKQLQEYVDSIIIIPNQKLMDLSKEAGAKKPLIAMNAFRMVDDVLRHAVNGVIDLIYRIQAEGINLDFADVQSVMRNSGHALIGIGEAAGDNRAVDAITKAVHNPLVEIDMKGAKKVLVNIMATSDSLGMHEIDAVSEYISNITDRDCNCYYGYDYDEELEDKLSVTVIATGMEANLHTQEPVENKEPVTVKENENTKGVPQPKVNKMESTGDYEVPAWISNKKV